MALPVRIAVIGNHVPRQCGIATFTTDLCDAIAAEYGAARVLVVAVNDPQSRYSYPARVRFEITEDDLSSYQAAADFLNSSNIDLVCLQHEYGIFGGKSGSHVLRLLQHLKMPVVTATTNTVEAPYSAAIASHKSVVKVAIPHCRGTWFPITAIRTGSATSTSCAHLRALECKFRLTFARKLLLANG